MSCSKQEKLSYHGSLYICLFKPCTTVKRFQHVTNSMDQDFLNSSAAQLVKKFRLPYKTWRFITVSAKAPHLTLLSQLHVLAKISLIFILILFSDLHQCLQC